MGTPRPRTALATVAITAAAFAAVTGAASATVPAPVADAVTTTASAHGTGHAVDRVLVKFGASGVTGAARKVERRFGATGVGRVRDLGVRILAVPPGAADRVANALARSAGVRYAEPDGLVHATQVPNDTNWSSQWGPALVNAPSAWDMTTGSASTTVAVLDTGVDFSHPDLAGRFVAGYDFINNDSDPTDDNGHGTSTAGIVGAASNNATGIAGMCWSCSVMPVKVLDSTAYGAWSAVSNGITWATDHGAKVISMSLAGSSGSSTLQSAVNYAENHDVLVVAAAGNNGNATPVYPAAYSGVVSVAGMTNTDSLYSWSDYGSWVSVAAPGCDYATTKGGGYGTFCGTSAAAPVVAGIAGLARSLAPTATAAQIANALETSATSVGSIVAYGRVDAAATLTALGGTVPAPSPSASPTSSPSPAPSPTDSASPAPAPTVSTSPSPSTPPMVRTTFTGSLSSKQPARTYTVTSGAGDMSLALSFTRATSLTAKVTSGGQTVLTSSGASPVGGTATVPAGTYTITVSGSSRASFTLTVTNPAP